MPSPAPSECNLPNDVIGQTCATPPPTAPANTDPESVSSCTSVASNTYCWASCAVGFSSSSPLQALCCNAQWLPWIGGPCVRGSSCTTPPSFAPDHVNATSVQGCVNVMSGSSCVAKCAANFTASVPPPTAICDNGDWTDWKGNCTATGSSNTTAQNGTARLANWWPRTPTKANTKSSSTALCATDQLPPKPNNSGGWSTQRWLKTTSIPGPSASNKLIGHVSTLLSDRCPLQLADWANSYGPVYKLQLLNRACVILTDPAAAHELIRWGNSENYLGKTRELYRALELGTEPKMPNILTSPDDVYWKAVRQATAPCFSISNLKLVFPWVLQLCDKAVHHVTSTSSSSSTADGKPGPAAAAAAAASIDVEDLAKRFTADVIGHMLFAEDLKSMDMGKSQYLEIFAALLEEVHNHFSNPLRPLMLKAMGWRPEVARGRDALAIHDRLMGAKLKAQLASPPPEYTITGHLLKVRDPATGQPLSFAQAKAEMAIMMGAGFETTSHALSWTLAALAAHPDVQDTLAAELAAAGLTPNKQQQQQQQRPLEWGDLALPYLNAVIKESLRLFSPAALGTSRACHKDVSVCGHTLPKGMHVIIPPYPIGVSIANYGPTAPRFIPERWLDTQQLEHLDALRESAGLLPRAAAAAAAVGFGHSSSSSGSSRKLAELAFSTGPRDCVGQSLAKLELQAMIATLAGHFALAPGKVLQERLAGIATAAAADEAAGSAAVDEDADADGEGESAGFVSQPNPADALKACIMYHVTLQPRGGNMVLRFTPRC
ncbi:hypothetical protein OEZ86_000961 [Tetradesmus obliquus]|nr:hypothetical protein OEZ86_000961 [Tetradesmus obliquus]